MGLFDKEPTRKELMLEAELDKQRAEVKRLWETIFGFGKRIGHFENQKNRAAFKRNLYKKKLRDLRTLYDALSAENTKLRKERAELKAKVIAMEPVYVKATLAPIAADERETA